MSDRNLLQPTAVLIVALVVILGGTFVVSLAVGTVPTGTPDGANIEGQSPAQYQPSAAGLEADPEDGELAIEDAPEEGEIVIDIRRASDTSDSDLEPVAEAMFEAGYSVTILDVGSTQGLGEALNGSSGLLIVQPAEAYPENERDTIQSYVETGGHAVVAGEPTQTQLGTGLFATVAEVPFGATALAESYGVKIGSETLYNVNDADNDNNFKSIYATPSRGGRLTEGVERVTFDRSGYIVSGDDNVNDLMTTVRGTKTIDTRRADTYPVVARNDSVVFVADGSFLSQPELYDADNEVFTSNLIEFLLRGDPGGGFD
jgi:hypothetical protein